ncbi:Probable membrane transporter protein, partial [Durusdinium trenchii]
PLHHGGSDDLPCHGNQDRRHRFGDDTYGRWCDRRTVRSPHGPKPARRSAAPAIGLAGFGGWSALCGRSLAVPRRPLLHRDRKG